MYICEIDDGVQSIYAVVHNKEKAIDIVNQFAQARLVEVPKELPFIILETNAARGVKFNYVSFAEVEPLINQIDRYNLDNEFQCYATVYVVRDECELSKNLLSNLPHAYISNAWLKTYDEKGIALLKDLT